MIYLVLYQRPSAQTRNQMRMNFQKHTNTSLRNRLLLKTYPVILRNQQSKPNFHDDRSYVKGTKLVSVYPLFVTLMQTLAIALYTKVIKQM